MSSKWSFFCVIYIFLFEYNLVVLSNLHSALHPSNSFMKRLKSRVFYGVCGESTVTAY